MKDSLLFAEGFIGSAGSMVSDTAIGAVDLTQIIGIASIDGVNRLTGGQTPDWMKRDLQGTADNLSSLAELGVGTYTALTDPGAAMRIRRLIVLRRQGKPSGIKLPIWMPMTQEA